MNSFCCDHVVELTLRHHTSQSGHHSDHNYDSFNISEHHGYFHI